MLQISVELDAHTLDVVVELGFGAAKLALDHDIGYLDRRSLRYGIGDGDAALLARGIALLYNDGRPPSWDASERVLRDSVPYATGWLMAEAAKAPAVGRTTYIKSGGDMMSHRRTVLELRRLHREGVLLKRQGHKGVVGTVEPWKYRLGAADWHTLLDRDTRILF